MAKRWIVGAIWAILLALGLLTFGRNAAAEQPQMPNKVEKVTFLGAKHVKLEELQNLTGIRPGMPLNPNLNRQGCRKIIAKYEEMGRPTTHCQLIKGGNRADTEVIYQITEGPKIKVRDIQFVGSTFISKARLATRFQTASLGCPCIGGTYRKQMAEAGIKVLYEYFRGFGYQDVRIALETQRSADDSEITLIFHIQEGPRYRVADKPEFHVGKIRVTGNERISSESILAHVPLVPGQLLSYPDLKQAEQNLAELGLFVVDDATGVRPTITVVDVEGDSDRKDLLITVKEKAKSVKRSSAP